MVVEGGYYAFADKRDFYENTDPVFDMGKGGKRSLIGVHIDVPESFPAVLRFDSWIPSSCRWVDKKDFETFLKINIKRSTDHLAELNEIFSESEANGNG